LDKERFYDIWRRAEEGPICPEREFDTKVLWPNLKSLSKEYDIRYDSENLVPTDTSLMDDVYNAGVNLLVNVGVLCLDTERIIKFEEHEIKEAVKTLSNTLTRGEGKDAVTYVHRKLEDKTPPRARSGPAASPISIELALPIYQSYTQEPLICEIGGGTFSKLNGVAIKPGSPWEMRAEIINASLKREAARRAGRPGMPISGSTSVSVGADVGASIPDIGYRRSEARGAKLKPQLKIDYENLARSAHYMEYGSPISEGGYAYIYGLAGGPETASIVAVASALAGPTLLGTNGIAPFAYNTEYTGTTDRVSIWASSISQAAATRNSNAVVSGTAPYISYSGPCTSMSLYEIATLALARTAVGCHLGAGCGGRQGIHIDHCSGMEGRWAAEVGIAAAGMKLGDANELVKTLVSKYEDRIKARNPPPGKPFPEIYDTEKLVPSKEYTDLYQKTKKELQELGIDFERYDFASERE
jgi:methylamine--corrinoid protein Co-methyltransferase